MNHETTTAELKHYLQCVFDELKERNEPVIVCFLEADAIPLIPNKSIVLANTSTQFFNETYTNLKKAMEK